MNVNQGHALNQLMIWLEDNMAAESDLHFDNEGKVNSEVMYQALATRLSALPTCQALKEHLALSHTLLAQVVGLQRVHRPAKSWQPQLLTLIERKVRRGVFVSPCTNPKPYREFHYYHDENNTLWALLVMDIEESIVDVYLHPELYADPEVFTICTFFNTKGEKDE
ncbi:hypothetical protein [Vibrio sp. TBV020]|uniref:hypothetical protein n=1 Tax=Vibrio sp. TBV020 TaxID=3137398 RepID=UPI0038CD6591